MEPLPIDEILPQLIEQLRSAGAVVLKAEPGAGKTTRVPPAILDSGLANLDGKRGGRIVVLQPRRVAARAAAARMSEERGTALGADIGYQVRHEGKHSKSTRIIVCTEGVFLRQLQDDPSIEDTAVVVFDEFHERSINSDLALALTTQVRRDLRPDLRIVVMSATLDSKPITEFLDYCPAIESPGRVFPVAIEYLQFPSNAQIERLAVEGVEKIVSKTSGDVLVFLPGVGEIRETQFVLETSRALPDVDIMPLYGEMPLPDQMAVLRPGKRRKVVLATNVAETSLTIPGITGVVDTGFARVNKFDPNAGFNKLTLTRISKASAAQRTGRAGRTAPGECLRMWTEREQLSFLDYELPEIERVDLSECVLQLLAWGEKNLHSFSWFEKPASAAIDNSLELLERLGALRSGVLTELGKRMSSLPLQPRLARLLLEGARLGKAKRAALCAAVLSERSAFRSVESFAPSQYHSDSDVLDQVAAIEGFDRDNVRDTTVGLIIPGVAKQILRSSDQLFRLIEKEKEDAAKTASRSEEAILRAIMSAFPDRICKRRIPKERKAVMVGGRGVMLSEQSNVVDAPFFVAVDLVDLKKPDLIVRRASAVERAWLPESLITTDVDVVYDSTREKVVALKRTKFCDLILDENISSIPSHVDPGSVLAEAVAVNFDLSALIDEDSIAYLNRVISLREWLPELELPEFGDDPWKAFLPVLCCGSTSIAELRSKSMIAAIQSALNYEQLVALDKDAPESIALPNGRRVKLQYEPGKPPILAARIQEFFGMHETPRIARSRIPVMLHLLAPNYRVQQVTNDLKSFWANTYPQVKKDLKGRYPKHKWPDNPLIPIEKDK